MLIVLVCVFGSTSSPDDADLSCERPWTVDTDRTEVSFQVFRCNAPPLTEIFKKYSKLVHDVLWEA